MDDLSGQQLGQYTLIERIGQGGMSTVYRAHQPSVGREVAIKVLSTTLQQKQPQFRDRFYREVHIAAQLQHPHIVPIYDFGEQDGLPFIVMAYVACGSLADHVDASGPLPLDEVRSIVRQLATALEFAHSRNVIHRDVKPGNVLFDDSGNVYLADFGLAKLLGGADLTTSGALLGTPNYLAPDWGGKGDPTASVDLYALGVMTYEMLAGDVPYKASSPVRVLMAHVSQPVPDICDVRPDIPQEVSAVIRCAMAKNTADRFASVAEYAAALDDATRDPRATPRVRGSTESGPYFYPNRWGRSLILSAEQVLGRDQLEAVMYQAQLWQYFEELPPDNMKKEFPFEEVGKIMEAIYRIYGRRGAQAVGRASGQHNFAEGVKLYKGMAQVVTRAVPSEIVYRQGLKSFAGFFQGLSDQRIEIDETERHYIWRITRCPMCWGWHAEEPVCFLSSGVLSAAFSLVSRGKTFRVVETECIAMGDTACTFLIDKKPVEG